jgi:hypothetical protein
MFKGPAVDKRKVGKLFEMGQPPLSGLFIRLMSRIRNFRPGLRLPRPKQASPSMPGLLSVQFFPGLMETGSRIDRTMEIYQNELGLTEEEVQRPPPFR